MLNSENQFQSPKISSTFVDNTNTLLLLLRKELVRKEDDGHCFGHEIIELF